MKNLMFPVSIFLLILLNGCSDEKLRCQGIYDHKQSGFELKRGKAVVGLVIVRPWFIHKFTAPEWGGWVNVAVSGKPYSDIYTGWGGAVPIKTDRESLLIAFDDEKISSRSIIYDSVSGVINYEQKHDSFHGSFSGICENRS
jgi:hypothetical protein